MLAGGTSRRMGEDKALLDWGGRRAIDRVFELAASICGEFVLVSGPDYGLPFVADPYPLAGPTAGILAGAAALRTKGCGAVLVLAVDTRANVLPVYDTTAIHARMAVEWMLSEQEEARAAA